MQKLRHSLLVAVNTWAHFQVCEQWLVEVIELARQAETRNGYNKELKTQQPTDEDVGASAPM